MEGVPVMAEQVGPIGGRYVELGGIDDALKLPEGRLCVPGGPVRFGRAEVEEAVSALKEGGDRIYLEMPGRSASNGDLDLLSSADASFSTQARLIAYAFRKYESLGKGIPWGAS
jgi:hypothetical protein